MASKQSFEVEASVRHDMGKGASRRLRREEKVPGVVYGANKEPVLISLDQNKMAKALEHESFYSHILTLKTGTDSDRVILKAVQRHPFKPFLLHVDFQRINMNEKLHMHIPLHFLGAEEAPGVKEGGLIQHIMSDVEVSCLPGDLPEFIEINVADMALNDIRHLSDIKLPKGVEIVALLHEDDKPVVSIHLPRIEEEPVVEESAEPVSAEVPAIAQKSAEEIAAEDAAAKKAKEKEDRKK
jgi:large subunit ribosomal protein L25